MEREEIITCLLERVPEFDKVRKDFKEDDVGIQMVFFDQYLINLIRYWSFLNKEANADIRLKEKIYDILNRSFLFVNEISCSEDFSISYMRSELFITLYDSGYIEFVKAHLSNVAWKDYLLVKGCNKVMSKQDLLIM